MSCLEEALNVIEKIEYNGFKAYIVGGYVRDSLLNREAHDIDITTNAKPEELEKIFDKVIPTGLKFDGVTVKSNGYSFEVTTFRKDVCYYDHRHPVVDFAKDIYEDLSRRDFTINAMAYDSNLKLIDKFNGKGDLENKIIRCVGEPNKRFDEDALRILRAFYFSSKLNFDIDNETLNGINNMSCFLEYVSGERIYQELNKMFKEPFLFKGLIYLFNTKAISYLPNLYKGTEILLKKKIHLTLTEYFALCFYLEGISDRYKISNKEMKDIKQICSLVDKDIDKVDLFNNNIDILISANKIKEILDLKIIDVVKEKNELIISNIKELKIDAYDIINTGISQKYISSILNELVMKVLNKEIPNDKESMLNYISKYKN